MNEHDIKGQLFGPVVQLVRMLPCHGRGRGFESRPVRIRLSLESLFFMFFVYILYSELHDRYYIGQTHDVNARLMRHNTRMEKSTSPYVPWKLVLKLEKGSRAEAIRLERKLKNLNTEDLKRFIDKYR